MGDDPWLLVDDAHTAQMTERLRLMASRRDDVIATADPDPGNLLKMMNAVLDHLPKGYTRSGDHVNCPDGRSVLINMSDPFGTLGQILQKWLKPLVAERKTLVTWMDRTAIAIAVYVAFSGAVEQNIWSRVEPLGWLVLDRKSVV